MPGQPGPSAGAALSAVGHNSTWCFIGRKIRVAVESEGLCKSRWSEPAEWPRPSQGLLEGLTVRSSPAPAGLSFPLQPSAPATSHGPPGLLQEHQTASRPRFPRSFSPFPCNSLIPRYVWAGSVASLNKHQNRRRPCSDTDCGSVPRVPNPQGLSHRSAWILKDIKIEKDSLELIVLSEVSQRAKDKYHMISLACRI